MLSLAYGIISVYVNKNLINKYDPNLWNTSFPKDTNGVNYVNNRSLNDIATMVIPGSVA